MKLRIQIVGRGKRTWRHSTFMWLFHAGVWCVRHDLPMLPLRHARFLLDEGDQIAMYIDGRRIFGPGIA